MIYLRLHSPGRTEPGFGIMFELQQLWGWKGCCYFVLWGGMCVCRGVYVSMHACIKARGKPLVSPSVVIYFSLAH